MSHIFEALQRAEMERSGEISKQPAESVAELLQTANLLQASDLEAEETMAQEFGEPRPALGTELGAEVFAAKVLTPPLWSASR